MRTRALVGALALILSGCLASPADEPAPASPVPSVRASTSPRDGDRRSLVPVVDLYPMPERAPADGRPAVRVPAPHLLVVPVERPSGGSSHRTGIASWYCGHGSACTRGHTGGLYAAAGPRLRVGQWRGRVVRVVANGHAVDVHLIDVCACPNGRLLDLYSTAFQRLAPLDRGIVKVTVTW